MDIQTTIPLPIWDTKKFHWKLFLQGKLDSLSGCPNWLYEVIRQIKDSGQAQKDTIQVIMIGKSQYAIKFEEEDLIQVYSKKR